MKRIIQLPVFFLFLALIFWTGCNPGNTGGGGGGEKIQLQLKLEPGMVYKLVTTSDQIIDQKMMGMSQKMKSVTAVYLKNEVISVDDGVATVKTTYDRVRVEMDNGLLGKTVFDSNNQYESIPLLAKSYNAMVGKAIMIKMNKQGKVTEVTGVDALMDAVLESALGTKDTSAAGPAMNKLKATFGDEGIKSMMQSTAIMFPEVLISTGDTWGHEIGTMGEMPIKVGVTYKVDHIDAGKAVLSSEGKIETDKSKALDLGVVSVNYDLTGKYSGTSEIERTTGLLLKSDIEQTISGNMSTMGMNIPISIIQKITIERY